MRIYSHRTQVYHLLKRTRYFLSQGTSMLLLRRRRGQSIVIGRHAEIKVKIVEEKDGVVTVGIEAPKAILVDREEMYRKKEAELLPPEFSKEIKTITLESKKEVDYVAA